MKGCMFNIDNGYLEGLCRGFKNGILRQADYLNLVQCETLEDLKLHLQVPYRTLPFRLLLYGTSLHAWDTW
jgi:vacuolar-type H+-ATPase subunit C/Vma6